MRVQIIAGQQSVHLYKKKMTPEHQTPIPTNFTISSLQQPLTSDIPTLSRTRTFSFQTPPEQSASHFCSTFLNLQCLDTAGKRMLDSNVVALNSTQKQMVQIIVETNRDRNDEKSKYLSQRANRFLKILWKAEKYSDSCLQGRGVKKEEKVPRYASPIRQFKQHKLTRNNSFGTKNQETSKTKSGPKYHKNNRETGQSNNIVKDQEKEKSVQLTSRMRHFHSEDKKFEKIRLSPNEVNHHHKAKQTRQTQKGREIRQVKQGKQTPRQKSFQIDLTKNITWKTMLTTKNFENMLKVLK